MTIHASAVISSEAKLGANVSVGPFSIIHEGVTIGANSVVESFCELGKGGGSLSIGENALIRSHAVFYGGSSFGANLRTGHHVTVLSGVTAGRNFQIGSNGDVQGPSQIGNFVSFQSKVFVAPNTVIKDFCWVFINAVLTNDPTPPSEKMFGATLEEFAVIGAGAVVLPGVIVGKDAVVAANSTVTRSVGAGVLVAGNPAREICKSAEVQLRDDSGRAAYPWRGHFRSKYPPEITSEWDDALLNKRNS